MNVAGNIAARKYACDFRYSCLRICLDLRSCALNVEIEENDIIKREVQALALLASLLREKGCWAVDTE